MLALDQLMVTRATRLGVTPGLVGNDPGLMMELDALVNEAIPLLHAKKELPPIVIRAKGQ